MTSADPAAAAFHGNGIAFPVRPAALGLAQSSGARKVEESIRIILGTQYGERVMRPRFGSNLKSLAFAPNDATTAHLARHHVEEALRQWEPRIELLDVTVDNDLTASALLIGVTYLLRATRETGHLVLSFLLEQPR
ncbi:GPW/gp25 family protein [Streptomyces sp. NBC_01275]|uniref:GPW/gp25 family protein n=1 Tax=Streptomyces sp. NBC_01275 TaxID=2903807 RepID=UPI00224D5027|nr:GPW/gp25 family protein [Streptomyces sp. NBC_01275]MCX4759750.1 GPW/gp25 family protein [Streptomyces sp. NBC_01275]